MSSPGQREMLFCHRCAEEWYRDDHGLTCPRCHSEFVEVIEANNSPHAFLHGIDDGDAEHNHWTPPGGGALPGNLGTYGQPGFPFSNFPSQPANRGGPDFRYTEHRTPGGGMIFTSFSYSSNGRRGGPSDANPQTINNFSDLLQALLGDMQASRGMASGSPFGSPFGSPPGSPPPPLHPRTGHSPQQPQQMADPVPNIMSQFFQPQADHRSPGSPGSPSPPGLPGDMPPNPLMGIMRMILGGSPMLNMGGRGDAAYSQEEFDRIMSQLLEQAQQAGGVPPASAQEISRLPKKTITQEWLDSQEHKECTICLNEAKVDEDINELWCGHWYHPECIKMWLDSHDQCPLCRKPLQQSREEYEAKQSRSPKRKHSSRHHNQGHWRGSRDDGGSGSSSNPSDSSSSGGGGLRDRISHLFRGNSR